MVFCLHCGVLHVMTNVENRPKFNVFGPPGGAIEEKHHDEIVDESGRLTSERETREETGVDLTKLSKTQHIGTFSLGHGISYVVYFSRDRMPNGAPWSKNNDVSNACHMRSSNVFSMLHSLPTSSCTSVVRTTCVSEIATARCSCSCGPCCTLSKLHSEEVR